MSTVEEFDSEESAVQTLGVSQQAVSLIYSRRKPPYPAAIVRVWATFKKRGGKWHFWTSTSSRPTAPDVGTFVFQIYNEKSI